MERRTAAGPKSEARKLFLTELDTDEDGQYTGSVPFGLTTAQAIAKYKVTAKLEAHGAITILNTTTCDSVVQCLKYTEEFEYLAAGFTDGVIKMYDSETMDVVKTLMENDVIGACSTCIKHRPVNKDHPISNTLICTYENGYVKNWNYNFQQCIFTIKEKRETRGVAFHLRLPKFVTFGDDKRIYLYDEETRTQERVFAASEKTTSRDGHEDTVKSACFNPRSNNELITGGADGYVLYWDIRQPNAVKCLAGINIKCEGLDINPKGTEILAASYQKDNPLQIFEYESGNFLKSVQPDKHNKCMLTCGKYISKDYCITGGEEPNLFRLIDLRNNESAAYLCGLPGSINALDIGPEKKDKVVLATKKRKDLSTVPKVAFCSGSNIYQAAFNQQHKDDR